MHARSGNLVVGAIAVVMAGALATGTSMAADRGLLRGAVGSDTPLQAQRAAPPSEAKLEPAPEPSSEPAGKSASQLAPPPANLPFKRPKTDNPTRDGTRARASRNIMAAWFSGLVPRYRHSPFGIIEQHPDTLTVSLADRRVLRFTLPPDSVFEDRAPRIADLDGDGRDEIIVVRSTQKKGSALAVIGVKGSALAIIAATPPLGTPFEWLNPAGIADFDGDGRLDVAFVVKPHKGGELQFWTLRDGTFEQLAEIDDVSNHVQGSTDQALSAVADFDGDGVADLAIASENRRTLRFLTLSGGKLRELGAAPLPAPVAENFEVVIVDGLPAVRIGIAGKRTITVVPCRAVEDWRMAKGRCP